METVRRLDRARAQVQFAAFARAAMLPAILFLLHALLLSTMGDRAGQASFVFLIGLPLLAGCACIRLVRRESWEGWLPLAAAMLCWAGGMAATMVGVLMLDVESEVSLSMLLYVLYGVPLIFALASPPEEAWYVRCVDAVLAGALGYLFFVYVFTLSTMSGTQDANAAALRRMFDVENLYIATFALIRLAACRDTAARLFLRVLTAYAVVYLLVAAYINHVQAEADFGLWPDLVIDLPFLLLLARTVGVRRELVPPVSRRLALIVRAGSPLMLPATLLTVSAFLLSHDARLAVAGCIVATLGYGLRSVLVQLRSYDEQDRLAELSHADALTGLANRRLFDEVLRREAARAQRHGGALALMMVDIDHFKLLNDHYGHPVGDARLREVAAALSACARRGTDLAARYGGEEFAMILPDTDAHRAAAMAEQIREAVENLALPSPAPGGVVTVSIGVSHTQSLQADVQKLIDSADRALYDAKRGGRNRIALERLEPLVAG
ncbi:GGDEF domain-containing protein [Sphingobium sp.]|uniref:GGDEF domain-containing protein n=1 Tax=Sphingobium sp. TaxID=1912891 RepID=UPI002B82C4F8|nr:GGDEF domain-containing protein [Sphingobium sp.]HUD91027.1 GGDEF domain-containing protein [Sphingobium sp.]